MTTNDVHHEAVALLHEALEEYLPYARVRRSELDNATWEMLLHEARAVVARTA
ncbi:hypothetical protein [Miniimonas arenae]|uniref:hypothetical protein n=1 Tax=Miniimonas arenae TaxID=676201 RepID=UPI0015D624BC|nr:hypothetical protein [Miniimonas arenae]